MEPARREDFTDVGLVQQRRQHPRINLTRLPTARPAIQPCGVRVVRGLAAMTEQQYQPRKATGETHRAQDFLRERSALCIGGRWHQQCRAQSRRFVGSKANRRRRWRLHQAGQTAIQNFAEVT